MGEALKPTNVTSSILGVSLTGYTVHRVPLFTLEVTLKPRILIDVVTWDGEVTRYIRDKVYGGLFGEDR